MKSSNDSEKKDEVDKITASDLFDPTVNTTHNNVPSNIQVMNSGIMPPFNYPQMGGMNPQMQQVNPELFKKNPMMMGQPNPLMGIIFLLTFS